MYQRPKDTKGPKIVVVGFTAAALAGAAALERLRLPESIESLPDGLFRKCPALIRLILEHRSQPCSVTAHTFDAAGQVKVFVPSEAYSMYRDGVGCEANPWAPLSESGASVSMTCSEGKKVPSV